MGNGFDGQRALVTGANGFLGAHLVRALARSGCAVHALVRRESGLAALDDVPGITCWVGDVTDRASLTRCYDEIGPRVIYHLAGDTRARRFMGDWHLVDGAIQTNLIGTLNIARVAAESTEPPQVLVRVGGLEEYGSALPPFRENEREAPRSPYSASQVAATHFLQAIQAQIPFAMITLRPTLIYGPGQSEDFLIPALIRSLLSGHRFALSSGEQRRDLLHVDDFVSGALATFGRVDLAGAVLNLATGISLPIRDVATHIADLIGAPDLIDIGAAPGRAGDIIYLRGDASEAASRLGWLPEISLEEGLRSLIAWHRREMVTA